MSVQLIDTVEQAREVSFPVTGMTCASCVRRIEKALNRVEGVQEASVNLATEKARVLYDPSVADFSAVTVAVERPATASGSSHRRRRHKRPKRNRPKSTRRSGSANEKSTSYGAAGWWRCRLVSG